MLPWKSSYGVGPLAVSQQSLSSLSAVPWQYPPSLPSACGWDWDWLGQSNGDSSKCSRFLFISVWPSLPSMRLKSNFIFLTFSLVLSIVFRSTSPWLRATSLTVSNFIVLIFGNVSKQNFIKDNVQLSFFKNGVEKPESKSQSKVPALNPNSQIQRGKRDFELWVVSKILWATQL